MTDYGPYPGVVTEIHDGDTFRVQVTVPAKRKARDIGWDVTVAAKCQILVDVRLDGCNAAELGTAQGKAALAYLTSIMPVGTQVFLISKGWDKYAGRSDAAIYLPNGHDLTTDMIAAGQAAPWNGEGPKPVPSEGKPR